MHHENTNQKKAGVVVILLSGNIDYRTKDITRDKDRPSTMIKGWFHQKDTPDLSIATPNIASEYMPQKLMEQEGEAGKFQL